jgi:hypothetical protein
VRHFETGAAALREAAEAAEQRRPCKPFFPSFSKSACFLQTFPKEVLAVLWNFKGLRESQTEKAPFQIFSRHLASF